MSAAATSQFNSDYFSDIFNTVYITMHIEYVSFDCMCDLLMFPVHFIYGSHLLHSQSKEMQFGCDEAAGAVRARSHVPVLDPPGAERTGESTTWNFNNISGSNRPVERPRRL
jgi:hypothetical protein